jgi:RNA polymerase sigma factor (sigma-70 family)
MRREKDRSVEYTEDDITNNMGLVFTTARRMRHLERSGVMEFQDLISEGVLGLIHSLDRFDKSKGFRFSSYAVRCISGYMLQGHRRLHMEQWKAMQSRYEVPSQTFSMYQPGYDEEVRQVVGCDDRGMSAKVMFNKVANRRFWAMILPQLTPRQRQVLTMLRDGLTQTQIAPLLGVSRQCISQTMQLAIENAKRYLAQEEERNAA